jgi:hypothetical protein
MASKEILQGAGGVLQVANQLRRRIFFSGHRGLQFSHAILEAGAGQPTCGVLLLRAALGLRRFLRRYLE